MLTINTCTDVLTLSLINYLPTICNFGAIPTEFGYYQSVAQEKRYDRDGLRYGFHICYKFKNARKSQGKEEFYHKVGLYKRYQYLQYESMSIVNSKILARTIGISKILGIGNRKVLALTIGNRKILGIGNCAILGIDNRKILGIDNRKILGIGDRKILGIGKKTG